MKRHPSITPARLEQAVQEEYLGICIACGAERGNVEPDARRYKCDTCGALEVYGAEELLLMVEDGWELDES